MFGFAFTVVQSLDWESTFSEPLFWESNLGLPILDLELHIDWTGSLHSGSLQSLATYLGSGVVLAQL